MQRLVGLFGAVSETLAIRYWWNLQAFGSLTQMLWIGGILIVPFVVEVPFVVVVVPPFVVVDEVLPEEDPVPPEKPPPPLPPPLPLPGSSAKMQDVAPFTFTDADPEDGSTVPFR